MLPEVVVVVVVVFVAIFEEELVAFGIVEAVAIFEEKGFEPSKFFEIKSLSKITSISICKLIEISN